MGKRDGQAGPGAAPRLLSAAGVRPPRAREKRTAGKNFYPTSPGHPEPGLGCRGDAGEHSEQRKLPAPPFIKSGDTCLTKHNMIQAFVQNILIKILSDIDTHTNDRTLMS